MLARVLVAARVGAQQQQQRALLSSSSTSSMMDMFKSVGKYSEQKLKNARVLLGQEEEPKEKPSSFIGHSHGEHATMIERDLIKIVQSKGGHGHSHGDDDHGHGHSHGDGDDHGHGHSHGDDHGHSHSAAAAGDDEEEDFIEMWNPSAPAGPEHGGPRGKEPTRYKNEWECKGRVSDFS